MKKTEEKNYQFLTHLGHATLVRLDISRSASCLYPLITHVEGKKCKLTRKQTIEYLYSLTEK